MFWSARSRYVSTVARLRLNVACDLRVTHAQAQAAHGNRGPLQSAGTVDEAMHYLDRNTTGTRSAAPPTLSRCGDDFVSGLGAVRLRLCVSIPPAEAGWGPCVSVRRRQKLPILVEVQSPP